MTIKAIQTVYNGYHFRSRLEARWAVFFDAAGIKYSYETQGFEVKEWFDPELEDSKAWKYLPDFYLPDLGAWVEVKGSLLDVSDDYLNMIAWAVDWGGALPGIENSCGTTQGLIWLGEIPNPAQTQFRSPTFSILQHGKGGWMTHGRFIKGGIETSAFFDEYFDATWGDAGKTIRRYLSNWVYADRPFFFPLIPFEETCNRAFVKARMARFEHGETPIP